MTRPSRVLAACLALFASTSALAVELNYKWKKGDTHRFSYEDDTTFEMAGGAAMPGMGMAGMPGMAGMGAGMKMKLISTFTEKVLAVRPDGSADIELTVNKLDFYQGGSKVASIANIPPAARVVKAEVDRKGRAKFYKMVTVYMRDDQMYLGVHSAHAGPNGASMSASDGNQQIDVVASVDPKTGKLTASMKVTERPPALKKVSIKEEDPGVDVLPKQIFEMMVLPDGNMEPGKRVDITMPMGTLNVELAALKGTVAELRTVLNSSAAVATPAESSAPARGKGRKNAAPPPPSQDEDQELGGADVEDDGSQAAAPNMGGMNMGGMNMGGMNMGGVPGGANPSEGGMAAGMKMDVDVTCGFDVAAGKLLSLSGTLSSDMGMGGMEGMGGSKVNSRVTLKRIP